MTNQDPDNVPDDLRSDPPSDTTVRAAIADATRPTAVARSLHVALDDTRTLAPGSSRGEGSRGEGSRGESSRSELGATPVSRPMATETVHLHRGEIWGGDFELGPLIGRGGMGAVYAGRQHSLERQVAIKALKGSLGDDPEVIARFEQEAKSLARINSPHVIQVFVFGRHRHHHFLVMELVEGEDLARKLKGGWRPGHEQVVDLMMQAAKGLMAAGEHGIVHRDIKPGNLMLTSKGVLKVMDFGLARLVHASHSSTSTGIILGTDAYMSPEQCSGRACDQRSDIYSLGVVFYELLTGRKPFVGETHMEVFCQHLEREPTPPRDLDRTIPVGVESVVLACLIKDPNRRYQSAAALLDDLQRLAAHHEPAALPRRRGDGLLIGAIVGLAILTLALAVVWRKPTALIAPASVAGQAEPSSPPAAVEGPSAAAIAAAPGPAPAAEPHDQRSAAPAVDPAASASHATVAETADPALAQRLVERTAALDQMRHRLETLTPARVAFRRWQAFLDELPAEPAFATLRGEASAARDALAWADRRPDPVPSWAARSDCDDCGPWVEAQSGGYAQRFRHCPAGTFATGEPPLRVAIDHGFWLADSETTVAQWRAVTGGEPPTEAGAAPPAATLPATAIAWDEARGFCARLGERLGLPAERGPRLPDEAQWEYACRAGYDPAGAALDELAWTRRNTTNLVAVGRNGSGKSANAWGLFDMQGNALEWCSDVWIPDRPADGQPPAAEPSADRACRGGSYDMQPEACRASARWHLPAISHLENLGMRVLIPE